MRLHLRISGQKCGLLSHTQEFVCQGGLLEFSKTQEAASKLSQAGPQLTLFFYKPLRLPVCFCKMGFQLEYVLFHLQKMSSLDSIISIP